MRTIGRHTDFQKGDRQARCDYCGTQYRRSDLQKNSMGLLYCGCVGPEDDLEELERQNQAMGVAPQPLPDPGGSAYGHNYGPDPDPTGSWMTRGLLGNTRYSP